MSEKTEKNIIIKSLDETENYDERLEAIKSVLTQSPMADSISLRIYRAEEDQRIIVEKWAFESAEIKKAFIESDGIVLGPWPNGNFDQNLGDLSLDSDNSWEE